MNHDIPIGKAIVPEESEYHSQGCMYGCPFYGNCKLFACTKYERKDGKNVIFKLIDYLTKKGGSYEKY